LEGFLTLGFLIGMSHAVEADHLAAVATMATDRRSGRRRLALRGAVWGVGHTITLFVISMSVVMFGLVLTDALAAALEFGVGVMLLVLGLHVLIRMYRQRVHFHCHDHGDGRQHIHAHSHASEIAHDAREAHDHEHPQGFPFRALMIGLVHGAAGSAGLLALAVAATQEPIMALGYVAVFGLGSIAGMALLSLAVSWPLGFAERGAWWLHRGLTVAVAIIAIGFGVDIMIETGALAWKAF
jgi:hypothetical protein